MIPLRLIFISMMFIEIEVTEAYNRERLLRLRLGENQKIKHLLNYPEDFFLNFTERSAKYGYQSQAFKVTTDDGYVLTVFRMLQRPHCEKLIRPPVLIQHGLFVNAINWLDPGPKVGIPYLLADACFDVWCGNARGTEFSRNHTRLNPDKDPKFWQFSFHEIGLYDFPATIDFILTKSNNTRLNFIGHSQACSAIFVLASMKPSYMDKLNVIISLAPAFNLKHSKNSLFRTLARIIVPTYLVLDTLGIQEVLHRHSVLQEFFNFLCQSRRNARLCFQLLSQLDGVHKGSITADTLTLIFAHGPDGVSLKSIDHLLQMINTGEFREYDYREDNMNIYGKEKPPSYDVNKVTVPVQIIYGENDHIVNASDVRSFVKNVRNLRELYQVEDLQWNHVDFIWSSLIPKYVYPKIRECLDEYSYV